MTSATADLSLGGIGGSGGVIAGPADVSSGVNRGRELVVRMHEGVAAALDLARAEAAAVAAAATAAAVAGAPAFAMAGTAVAAGALSASSDPRSPDLSVDEDALLGLGGGHGNCVDLAWPSVCTPAAMGSESGDGTGSMSGAADTGDLSTHQSALLWSVPRLVVAGRSGTFASCALPHLGAPKSQRPLRCCVSEIGAALDAELAKATRRSRRVDTHRDTTTAAAAAAAAAAVALNELLSAETAARPESERGAPSWSAPKLPPSSYVAARDAYIVRAARLPDTSHVLSIKVLTRERMTLLGDAKGYVRAAFQLP